MSVWVRGEKLDSDQVQKKLADLEADCRYFAELIEAHCSVHDTFDRAQAWLAANAGKAKPQPEISHVCGLQGFGRSLDDYCPACRNPPSPDAGRKE